MEFTKIFMIFRAPWNLWNELSYFMIFRVNDPLWNELEYMRICCDFC